MADLTLKNALLDNCKKQIEARIANLQSEFAVYKDAVVNETKSTAGDKHDTSRSMMQLEQEKMGTQLKDLISQKKVLEGIDLNEKSLKLKAGSILKTDSINFFISVFAKPITFEEEIYHPVSMQSPLIKLFINKQVGERVIFNNKAYTIKSIDI